MLNITNNNFPLSPILTYTTALAAEDRPNEERSNLRLEGGVKQPDQGAKAKATGGDGGGSFSSKPNVFFIMIDDMGWNDIGYQSTDLFELTPNLDKLASNGIKV